MPIPTPHGPASQSFHWSLYSPPMLLRIGPKRSRVSFHIHRTLLTLYSLSFATVLNNAETRVTSTDRLDLSHKDHETFTLFARFVYTGKLFTAPPPHEAAHAQDKESAKLVDLWRLGQRLRSTTLKDAVVDAVMVQCMNENRLASLVPDGIYPYSSADSGIRQLLVDLAVHAGPEMNYLTDEDVPEEVYGFWCDVVKALNARRKGGGEGVVAPWEGEGGAMCSYHEHEEGEVCYISVFGKE